MYKCPPDLQSQNYYHFNAYYYTYVHDKQQPKKPSSPHLTSLYFLYYLVNMIDLII